MTALHLAAAIAMPLAAVATAWINYRRAAEIERWRTQQLAMRLGGKKMPESSNVEDM